MQKAREIPHMRIAACTAFLHGTEIKKVFEIGMDEYVQKPISLKRVIEILKKYNLYKDHGE